MNKKEIIRILEETREELEKKGNAVDCSLLSDDECLYPRHINGRPAFYVKTKGGKQVYIRLSDKSRIRELATKHCARKLKSSVDMEMEQINNCIEILDKNPQRSDVDTVLETVPAAIKDYADFSELSSEGYARKWQESNSMVKKFVTHKKDVYHKLKTLRGDYVGSKSELIIADRLFVKGIPYHYEIAFTPEARMDTSRPVYDNYGMIIGYESISHNPLEQDTLHPDFYVLNKRTGKAYFWEHLGKMDDPEYCRKNFNRFMRILDAGYVIGEDVIVTHEDSKNPLMTESIDRIIETYLK